MACTWVGTKFSHRVPEGKIVAALFSGRHGRRRRARRSDDAIVATVRGELHGIVALLRAAALRAHLPLAALHGAVHAWATRSGWPRWSSALAAIPGLYLAGNAYQGIGIPDCIRMGRAAAEKIAQRTSGM